MSETNQPLVRSQGIIVPQYFNRKENRYEVITGRNGANAFIEKGRIIKDAFSGSEDVTKSYNTPMFGFGIVNDGEEELSFTINEFTIVVAPFETFDDLFEPFKTVTVNAADRFRAVVRE